MIVGYRETFPWGVPTFFEQKVLASQIPRAAELLDVVPKIHTIREDASDRWHRGRGQLLKIHHSVHVRQKTQRTFWINECTGIQDFGIYWGEPQSGPAPEIVAVRDEKRYFPKVYINSIEIDLKTLKLLARNDGFSSYQDFLKWFCKDFDGKIIHWTDFRYDVDIKKVEEAHKVSLPSFSKNDLETILKSQP